MSKHIVSYAQNREDVILEAFFPDLKDGFYIDVGANDPINDSVTKLFYEKGWRGINVEPTKHLFKLLEQDRPRDININLGLSDHEGKLTLREYDDYGVGLSTFSDAMKKDYETKKAPHTKEYKDYEVPITTLANVFKDHAANQTVNFIKIDVEGYEYEVIKGGDWIKYRPQVICIEYNHIINDWRPMLEKYKYKDVFFDGLNEYYVASECQEIIDNFLYNYAQGTIGRSIITLPQSIDFQRLQSINHKLENDRINLQSKINEQNKNIYALSKQLEEQRRTKQLIKLLYKSLDNIAIIWISKIDSPAKKSIFSKMITPVYSNTDSIEDLVNTAHINDLENFYATKHHSAPSLRHVLYLITIKSYFGVRKFARTTAIILYKILKRLRR